jgi:plasmid stabilization system protein ParE
VKLRILDEAEEELRAAMCYYEARQQGLGLDLYERFAECISTIAQNPERFSPYESVRAKLGVRRALVDRFPYVIAYKVLANEVLVIAVAHASRRAAYWRHRAKNS